MSWIMSMAMPVFADANWLPVPGKRYVGIYGNAGWACEYWIRERSEEKGTITYKGDMLISQVNIADAPDPRPDPAANCAFELKRISTGQWILVWDDESIPTPRQLTLRWISTLQGECLAGQYTYAYSVEKVAYPKVILIWPDPDAQKNPFQWMDAVTPSVEDSYAGEFRLWTAENGLASNATRSIAQTPDGYIWIGTVEGLSRFDGMTWKTFNPKTDPAIPDTVIPSLAVDRLGRLIVGTNGEGIYRYGNGAFSSVGAENELNGWRITQMVVDHNNNIWISMDGKGLGRLNPDGRFQSWNIDDLNPIWHGIPDSTSNNLGTILPLRDGSLLLGVQGNILHFNPETGQAQYGNMFRHYNGTIFTDQEGGYWWMQSGLQHLNSNFEIDQRLIIPNGFTALSSRSRSMWFSNYEQQFQLHQYSHGRLRRFSRSSEVIKSSVLSMLEDHEGNIWLATGASGVVRYRPEMAEAWTYSQGKIPDSSVASLAVSRSGDLLYGYNTGGYNTFKNGVWSVTQINKFFPRPPNPSFQGKWHDLYLHPALFVDDENHVWCGLERTSSIKELVKTGQMDPPIALLAHVDLQGKPRLFFSDEAPYGVDFAYCVLRSSTGDVWLGTGLGLFQLPQGEQKMVHWSKKQNLNTFDCVVVIEDRAGRIWFGGRDSGLYQFHQNNLIHYSKATHQLASDNVLSLCEDSLGNLWVGSDSGLSRFSPDGKVTFFSEGSPLFQTPLHSILQDHESHFWFGSTKGVYGLRKQDMDAFTQGKSPDLNAFQLLGLSGFQEFSKSKEYTPSALVAPDGRLWFSSESSLLHVEPREVFETYQSGPPVKILSMESGEEVYYDSDTTHLHSKSSLLTLPREAANALTIHYTGMSYLDPENTRFQYQIPGVTKGWKDHGTQRSVIITKLSHGTYSFDVRAIAPHGLMSLNPARMRFQIKPYYHETWLFRASCGCGVVLLGIGAHRWRSSCRDRIKELEKKLALDSERSRIARDMHDDIGSALSRIRMRCESALELEDAKQFGEDLPREISRFAQDSSRSLREIIWSLNPNKSSYEDFAEYIRHLVETYFENSPIKTSVFIEDSKVPNRFSPALKRDLILILKGIMSNVLNHSQATEFQIHATVRNNELEVEAKDDGCGFDPSRVSVDSLGLKAIQDRLTLWKGTMEVHANPGKGVLIRFRCRLDDSFILPSEPN